MMTRARYLLLNFYHIVIDGLFDTVPILLTFMVLSFASGENGEREVGLIVSPGTALGTAAGLGTLIFASNLMLVVFIALLLGIVTKGTVPVVQTIITEPVQHLAVYDDIFSINSFLRGIMNMLTPLLFGFMASIAGMNSVYAIMAAVAAIAVIPVLCMAKPSTTP